MSMKTKVSWQFGLVMLLAALIALHVITEDD